MSALSGLFVVAALGLALPACGGSDDGSDPAPEQPGPPGDPNPPATVQPASSKARVLRKEPRLLANDLARALDLPRAALCQELDSYDCFETHNILLGGVEPYELRIDEPLAAASVASPMATDRVVLSACGERVALDFADPASAVLFAEVVAAAAPEASDREAVAARLYEHLLGRAARAEEVEALAAMFFEPDEEALAADAREWSQLACYAVATSAEFLFY